MRRSIPPVPSSWSAERRARQSALCLQWQPWRFSTGPRTELGKSMSSRNADKGLGTTELRQMRHLVAQLIAAHRESLSRV